jgi:hypothetical protein
MTPSIRTLDDFIEQLVFAFYGRVSTEDQQDPQASYDWQITRARQLIEPRGGVIVAEFFDIGHSRALPWQRRPTASQLLAALRDPNRGFNAVVIASPSAPSTATSSPSPSRSSSTSACNCGSRRSAARSTQAQRPTTSR